jgi:hypothetical protein
LRGWFTDISTAYIPDNIDANKLFIK